VITLARLDDRLIHGQVMAVWTRQLHIDHILLIDDATAADAFSTTLMQTAMPKHIALSIVSGSAAGPALHARKADATRTLLLFATVDVVQIVHAAEPLPHLNVANLGMQAGRALIWRSVALSAQEHAALLDLSKQIEVYLQMVPSDAKTALPRQAPL
jgi:mannose/fructose/N-acetylgalactosamine-specific phosphotransferase system component IIB